jgi:sugar phosphate isomerase/epimerase
MAGMSPGPSRKVQSRTTTSALPVVTSEAVSVPGAPADSWRRVTTNQAGSFEDPGQGLIDFARIFRHSDEAGAVEYIVERDDAGTPPREPADALDTARVGYQFLRTIRF